MLNFVQQCDVSAEKEPMVRLEKKVNCTMLKINEFNANKTHRPQININV